MNPCTSSLPGRSRGGLMLAVALGALACLPLAPACAAIDNNAAAHRGTDNPSGLGELLRQARQAMAQGRANVAVLYLKNAVALAPKNNNVRLELGWAFLKSGDAVGALREFRAARQAGAPDDKVLPMLYDAMLAHKQGAQLLDQFPEPAEGDRSKLAAATLRSRGVAHLQAGHTDLAAANLDRALAITRDTSSLIIRARIAKDQNDLNSALKLSEEALAKAPTDQNAMILRITLLQSSNKPGQAIPIADKLVKQHPRNPLSLLSRASLYIQLKQDAKARADVEQVLKTWKNMPQALYYKALLLERAKDVRGAWSVAQALPPEFYNSRPELAVLVAQMASAAGHNDVAITILSGALSRFPQAVEPRVQIAAHYLRLKNVQRALDVLLPMRESQEPRVMVLLGQAYAMQKQYAKSTEYYERASSTGFGGDLLKRQLAATNLQQGDLDSALKQLRDLNKRQPGDSVTAGLLVAGLLRSNDKAGAASVANKFASAAPKSPYGPLYQAQVLLAQSDFNGAAGAFSRALAIDPKFVPALYGRAAARSARGDIKGANADFNAVVAADPKNVVAMIRLAEINLQLKQEKNAEAILKRAVATDPGSSTANLALSSYYVSRKRLKDASAAIGAYRKRVPGDLNAQMVQAEIQLASGQADPALATFRRLAVAKPDSPQLQLMLASALVAKKDTNGAIAAYRRALDLSPKFGLARSALIRYALAVKKEDVALAAAQDGVKADPGTQSDLVLATTLLAMKKNDQAQAAMKQSLAQHPSEAGAILYSQILRHAKKAQQADAVLTGWIAKHPNDPAARLELGQAQMASNPAGAEQQFRAVLKMQPNNMVALNNLSWLLRKKDTKQAVVYAEQAVKLAPNSGPVLDTLGWVKWHAKDRQGALPILQKAYAADPKNPEIAYHLAVALDGNGRRAEAKKTLAAVLTSDAQFEGRAEAEALKVRWQ